MPTNSKSDICNLALSHLGNYGTVSDIDTPTNDKEITFSIWYDITREMLLKMTIPNFALKRRRVAKITESDIEIAQRFGFANVYEYPNDCLRLLGIGNVDEKTNDYAVEGNRIYTDLDYTETGLPIRFIVNVKDVSLMSVEFKMDLSWMLASNVVLDITQSTEKQLFIEKILPTKLSSSSAMNAQENRPIRINRSKFRESRNYPFPRNEVKK